MSRKLEEYGLEAPYRFLAPIAGVHDPMVRATLVKAIRQSFPGSADVAEEDIFTWPAVISNSRLDSYFTRMSESSLKNYAADAQEGVAFMTMHQRSLPTGYSLTGVYETGEGENFPRVAADFYTVKGVDLTDLPTANFIRGVQTGLIRDVSIGFKEGEGFQYTCSICGMDMWDWDCPHIPGVQYMVSADNPDNDPALANGPEEQKTCFAWIENARLSEVSAVYDGATPGAMVIKTQREQMAGRLRPETLVFLERSYRIHLPKRAPAIPVIGDAAGDTTNREVNSTMADKEQSGAPDNRMLDAECRLEAKAARSVGIDDTDTALDVVKKLRVEIDRLAPFETQAAEGKRLRAALVEETLKEGVRANKEFNREAQEKSLANLDIDTIQSLRDAWKGIADATFAGKGRSSQDDPENETDAPANEEDRKADNEVLSDDMISIPLEASGNV